jgi:hypothetical protein
MSILRALYRMGDFPALAIAARKQHCAEDE